MDCEMVLRTYGRIHYGKAYWIDPDFTGPSDRFMVSYRSVYVCVSVCVSASACESGLKTYKYSWMQILIEQSEVQKDMQEANT